MSYTVFLPQVQGGGGTERTAQVLALVNALREGAGLLTLRHDADLSKAAQLHAEDMRDRDYFAHDSPEQKWHERVAAHYKNWAALGEVIGAQAATAEGMVQAWIESEPHRLILTSVEFEDAGVGYAEGGGRYGNYYAIDFGRRRHAQRRATTTTNATATTDAANAAG